MTLQPANSARLRRLSAAALLTLLVVPSGQALAVKRIPPVISSHPRFQAWYQQHRGEPRAEAAKRVADQLTWAQLALIERPTHVRVGGVKGYVDNRGIQMFELQRGCPHACKGCYLLGGKQRPIKTMKFSVFKSAVDGLVGLEGALNGMMEEMGRQKRFHLIHEPDPGQTACANPVPFYASDPMQYWDRTAKKGIFDAISYFHSATGKSMDIVTSGWVPGSPQDRQARALLQDLGHGGTMVGNFLFQIKPVSEVFLAEAGKHLARVLRQDPEFQRRFGDDFQKHGLAFERYQRPAEAVVAYEGVVKSQAPALVKESPYLRARQENLKSVLAAAGSSGKVQVRIYHADETSVSNYVDGKWVAKPLVEAWVQPLVSQGFVSKVRQELQSNLPAELGDRLKFVSDGQSDWSFRVKLSGTRHLDTYYNLATAKSLPLKPDRLRRRYLRAPGGPKVVTKSSASKDHFYHFGMPMVTPWGTIKFTGGGEGVVSPQVPNMARSHDPHMRDLAGKPLFWPNRRPPTPWKLAGERMTGAQIADMQLSDAELASVGRRVRSQLRALGRRPVDFAKVSSAAMMFPLGGKLVPCVFVQLKGAEPILFNFDAGTLHRRDGRPLEGPGA